MIALHNIRKTFTASHGRVVDAVQDVSLHIEAGRIFGIMGQSGAGKSTLVRCINLLERPNAGEIWVDGVRLDTLSSKALRQARKKIGMIFQHFHLFPSRTVAQNIAFALKKSGVAKHDIAARCRELLALVGLSEQEHAYPAGLSGGQKQRVAIARALVHDPSVLLCDEATSALDPQTTRAILALLKELNRTRGITIVLITHEMEVLKEICDDVAVMEDGHVIEQGPLAQVFTRPQSGTMRKLVHASAGVDALYRLRQQQPSYLDAHADRTTVLLTYSGQNAEIPLISHLVSTLHIEANILCGNIQLLNGNPLGHLILSLRATQAQLDEAFAYIDAHHVAWEVLDA